MVLLYGPTGWQFLMRGTPVGGFDPDARTLFPRSSHPQFPLLVAFNSEPTKVSLQRGCHPPYLPGQWLQCQANGSNVCRVLRRAVLRLPPLIPFIRVFHPVFKVTGRSRAV